MEKRDLWKMAGLGVLAVLALLLARANLLVYVLRPEKRQQAWMQHGDEVLALLPRVMTLLCAGGMALLVLGIGLVWVRQRAAQRARMEMERRVAQGPTVLLLPRADWKPVKPEDVRLWARLADSLPHEEHISFEIFGNESGVGFGLHGSEEGVRAALTQFKAEWPGLFRKPLCEEEDPARVPEGWSAWWVELSPASYEQAVTAVAEDPLRAMLIEINGVLGQGRGLVQVIARRNFGARKKLGERAFAARDEVSPSKGVRALRSQEAREFEARARMDFLDVTVRVAGLADTAERAQGIARGLARAVAASFSGTNPVQPVRQGGDAGVLEMRTMGQAVPWAAGDLAYLAHLPGRDLMELAPRLQTAPARYLPAEEDMRFDANRYRTAFLEE